MDLLVSTSLVATFIVGMAALFAPCCITVLLPSYFASVFKEKKRVVLMTFIFFLGILTVFLPIGLGFSALSRVFSHYHNYIFGVGGVFLIVLGITTLLGSHFSLPWRVNPVMKGTGFTSIYTLGIFSGIATTCCAPVLSGVLALSTLSGSIFWGTMYTLSYVLGMVAPLFIIASFMDKFNFTKKFMAIRRPIQYSMTGRQISITISQLVSSIIFLAMGSLITFLALTNRIYTHASYQMEINIFTTNLINSLNNVIKSIPELGWAAILIIIIAIIVKISLMKEKNEKL